MIQAINYVQAYSKGSLLSEEWGNVQFFISYMCLNVGNVEIYWETFWA